MLTSDFVVKAFLINHLRALSETYDVTVIVNTNNPLFLEEHGVRARVISLAIARDISWFSDIFSLITLINIFRQERFFSVHSITPKAGLLAILAAWIVRVPLRIHTFTGQVWVTKIGIKRFLLKQFDCLIAKLTTFNIVDSPSQRKFLVEEKVLRRSKSIVFANGSISGVDIARFKPNQSKREKLRQQLNIDSDELLFLFVGRLTKDKGVLDLAHAFSSMPLGIAHLLFVGPDEGDMQIEIEHITESCSKYVHFVGHTDTPEFFMSAADVLLLPSYREGFGSVVIEAAAVGIPTIGSRIYGISDAVNDGESGLLHEPHDVIAIKNCMESLITNRTLRLSLGEKARARAVRAFDSKVITQELVSFYRKNIY